MVPVYTDTIFLPYNISKDSGKYAADGTGNHITDIMYPRKDPDSRKQYSKKQKKDSNHRNRRPE